MADVTVGVVVAPAAVAYVFMTPYNRIAGVRIGDVETDQFDG